ncbi:MAG: methylated-DNA--[protein]-cysteine S-methyltransferase [Erysipelotrichaceae bacterium]|nr:methylated-DNA--[protein]-cysteine S-methyltransferase [Erysipelotrichaceae bacterium]MDD3924552.1 methylated-DNA--[protein]-cysteine S-methyltransferase [Erysipelotrichaceae bacterium]MDD4642291.1 methylated-DNA--[protein]-cysteine S-methyltransferase [Erysipelotrichaceae bacterium]
MKNAYLYQMPIGMIRIVAEDDAIIRIDFTDKLDQDHKQNEVALIKKAHQQLIEYFKGKRKVFDININLIGTPFQKQVWQQLLKIPYGETVSYKWIAENIEKPKAYRAVGMANNRNPISIIVPCHRVIGHDGSLVGYGGGLVTKKFLIDLEKKTNLN